MHRRAAPLSHLSAAPRAPARSQLPATRNRQRAAAASRVRDWLRLFELSPYAAFLIDADGRLLLRNRRAATLPAAGSAFALMPAWAESLMREDALPQARAAGYWRGEVALLAAAGPAQPFSLIVEWHGAGPGQADGFFSCALHPLADYDAFESRLRFKGLFEAHPHPMWVYDLVTLRFLLVNAAAVHNYGYSEREFLAMTIADIRPEAEAVRLRQNLVATPPKGADQSGPWLHRRRDGSLISVEISSHSVTISGRAARFVFAHDVTAQLQTAAALHASRQMYQHIINNVPQQIFWKDLDLSYQGANQVFLRHAGADSLEQVIGKSDADFDWAHKAGEIAAEDRSIIASGQPLLNREDQMRMADGSLRWFRYNKLPLHDASGRTVGVLGTIEDTTERKQAELTQQLQGRAIEASVNAIVITACRDGTDDVIEYANPAFTQLTGYSSAQVLGRTLEFLLAPTQEEADRAALREALGTQSEVTILLRNYHQDGSQFWNQLHVAPVRNAGGAVSHHVCVLNDMTAVMRYQAELEHQANHDALTALPNRNLFTDRLRQAISYAQRYRHRLWVVFIDLDNFKLVNDTQGHQAGDELLRIVSARLRGGLRDSDTVARLGGDEFMMILHDYPQGHLQPALLHKLLDAVAAPLFIGGQQLTVTCSIGISHYPDDGADPELLLKHADIAMYRAKESGRNQIQFYEAAMNRRVAERSLIEAQLRHALVRNELSLHYQPRVDLRSGQVAGMEALLRWSHPQLGQVPPSRFIGVAEETGLIVAIGAWVLRTACAQNAAWQAAGLSRLRVAVNLSARQFRDPGLVETIVAALADSGLAAHYLELELTESLMMDNINLAVGTLQRLKKLGVALSIDDFGTGYSSLAYLKLLPLDYLKIDKSFIHDMLGDPSGAAIVRSVIALGHSLNFKVIAEGVETAAQLAYLRRYGCDEIQGYYFSYPVPAAELAVLLRQGKSLSQPVSATVPQRCLLLLDEDVALLDQLAVLLGPDGYSILRAGTAEQAFDLLALHEVQVIVCGQQSGGDSGTEFFSRVKRLYPGTVRILLAAYSQPEVVLDAINRGEIYRFYTRPWDDQALRTNIGDAFRYYQMMHGALRQR